MRLSACFVCLPLLIACGTPTPQKPKEVIIPRDTVSQVTIPVETEIIPSIPDNAVSANYINGAPPFYGFVDEVNHLKKTTLIRFEEGRAPDLVIEKSYGATIEDLRFPEFDSDLLLVTAVINDPNFNKYYLYRFEDNQWLPVVNGWAIHKDNRPDTLQPITVSSVKPGHMHRYYSVFDLDKDSELGYTWRLLEETIPVLAGE